MNSIRAVGIIAEYNPFHNGHSYHLKEAKRRSGADYAVVAMSGDFVQRGAPALIDKYARTRMALACGADLVLELPVTFSCASAEYFAGGAVSLLDSLGVADTLCFGSEYGETEPLTALARILLEEPVLYRETLQSAQKSGMTFPAARKLALDAVCPTDYASVLDYPNNILGIEYCKALLARNSSMRPLTIRREGSGYHEKSLPDAGRGSAFASAAAIRKAIINNTSEEVLENVRSSMPEPAFSILGHCLKEGGPVLTEDFSSMFHYRLLQMSDYRELTAFLDVSEDLARRIWNLLPQYSGLEDFISLLKTRQLTETRIRRALIHILLDIRTEDIQGRGFCCKAPYARVLGFRADAAPLLRAIKKNGSVPLITKLARAGEILTDRSALAMLQKDTKASAIYHCARMARWHTQPFNEYQHSPIRL